MPWPDKIEDIIRICLIFLPGFFVTSLLTYITDLNLAEFSFIYVSLAQSIIIFAIVWGVYRVLKIKSSSVWLFAGLFLVVAVSWAMFWAYAYEKDWLFSSLRALTSAERGFVKVSQSDPLAYLISANREHVIHKIDGRPVGMRLAAERTDTGPKLRPYSSYVRVKLEKGGAFEGFPKYFSLSGDSVQLVLTPACRLTQDGADTRYEPIMGLGVLIFTKEVTHIEWIELLASRCWHTFFGIPPQ